MTTDIFTQDPNTGQDNNTANTDHNVNAFESLVGEGKKFQDGEALAKGKQEADQFITKLQDELAVQREAFNKVITLQEQITSNADTSSSQEGHQDTSNQSQQSQGNPLDESELQAKFEEMYTQKTAEAQAGSNLERATQDLIQSAGSESAAIALLQSKARELGVSTEYLKEQARTSPQLFSSLLGTGTRAQTTPLQGTGSAPSQAPRSTDVNNPENYAYYQNLLKTDSAKFMSKETSDAIAAKVAKYGIEWMSN